MLRDSFDAKVGARHGSTICCSTPELTRTATPAREKCMRPSCRTKVPMYVLVLNLRFPPFPRRAADSIPTSISRRPNKLSSRRPTTRTRDTPNVTRVASSALPLMHPQRRPPALSLLAHHSFRFRLSSVLMDSISSSLTSASSMVVCAAVSKILASRPLRN